MQDSLINKLSNLKSTQSSIREQTCFKTLQSSTYLSRKEAAKKLGICVETLSKYATSGYLRFMRLGDNYIFIADDINAFDINKVKYKHK